MDRPDEALKGDPWLTRPLKRPSVAVRRMQSTIATNAHKLVYSLDGEPPVAGDAVDVLLEAMLRVCVVRETSVIGLAVGGGVRASS